MKVLTCWAGGGVLLGRGASVPAGAVLPEPLERTLCPLPLALLARGPLMLYCDTCRATRVELRRRHCSCLLLPFCSAPPLLLSLLCPLSRSVSGLLLAQAPLLQARCCRRCSCCCCRRRCVQSSQTSLLCTCRDRKAHRGIHVP